MKKPSLSENLPQMIRNVTISWWRRPKASGCAPGNLGVLALWLGAACGLQAGAVNPSLPEADWMEPAAWAWRVDGETQESIEQIPQPSDTIYFSRAEGAVMSLADSAGPFRSVIVGNPSVQHAEHKLILQPGAHLEVEFLELGRAGRQEPACEGILEIQQGAKAIISRQLTLGGTSADGVPANNGILRILGGNVEAQTLRAGAGGTSEGSRIRLEGNTAQLEILGDAVLHGLEMEKGSGGVVLELVADAQGFQPIRFGGDVSLTGTPSVVVDLSAYRGTFPAVLPILEVQGKRDGGFAEVEVRGLPSGTTAQTGWQEDKQLILTVEN